MKKIIILICCAIMTVGTATAQSRIKIGNLEFSVQKNTNGNDTVMQIDANDDARAVITRSRSEEPIKRKKRYHSSSWYFGLEFAIPQTGSDYLTIQSGNSYQFSTGYRHCLHFTRWYGIGLTAQYAFYNYRLKDASESLIGADVDTNKEVFRSNNLGVGVFNRFNILPGKHRRPDSDGLYIDIGVQGEWAYGRFYKMEAEVGDYTVKTKYRNGYAYNPFTASAFAGIGIGWFEVFAHYRFTDIFNSDVISNNLPPITVGVRCTIDW